MASGEISTGTITDVTENEKNYVITYDSERFANSFILGKEYKIIPKKNDIIEMRVVSMSLIRAVKINGKTAFDKTDIEAELERKKQLEEIDAAKKEQFNSNKNKLDKDYEALPECFKKRLDKFRKNNKNFRWEFEPYEMMCCAQAVIMAKRFPTVKQLKDFKEKDYHKQKEEMPELDDGHSGNSFGCAWVLASLFAESRYDEIIKMHGALAPLVGSKTYGCVPTN